MPAKGQSIEGTTAHDILTWLRANPGEHRARDVAHGLGIPEGKTASQWSQRIGNVLGRMARAGSVERTYRDVGRYADVGHYSAPKDGTP